MGKLFYASESVGEGHSDKLCDQISDAILDACLKIDPDSKVAIETAVSENMVSIIIQIYNYLPKDCASWRNIGSKWVIVLWASGEKSL